MIKNKQKEISTDFFSVSKVERFIMFSFLVLLTLIWSVPIYTVIKDSLKVNGVANFSYVWNNTINGVPFYRYFINSGFNAMGSSTLVVLVAACSGYAFSKIPFTGRKLIFNVVLMFMAISAPVLIVPFFFILKETGFYNSNIGIFICEAIITIPFGTLMMKNFFDGLPKELMDSANIDGANVIQVFTRIYLPLARPAVINLGVLQIMWSLQDFLFPLMFLTSDENYTATVAVNTFQGAYGMSPQDLGRYNAALILIAIPAIAIFLIAQKYIINGVTSGSVKE